MLWVTASRQGIVIIQQAKHFSFRPRLAAGKRDGSDDSSFSTPAECIRTLGAFKAAFRCRPGRSSICVAALSTPFSAMSGRPQSRRVSAAQQGARNRSA